MLPSTCHLSSVLAQVIAPVDQSIRKRKPLAETQLESDSDQTQNLSLPVTVPSRVVDWLRQLRTAKICSSVVK